jgi:hypothetical protein
VSALAQARPARPSALAVLASPILGLLVSFAAFSLLGSGQAAAPSAPFTVAVPHGWRALSARELASVPGHPAAVIRRSTGAGVVVVRRSTAVNATVPVLVRELGTRLRARYPGFHVVGTRVTTVRAGRAFVYTFVRDPARTAQTIAFVTSGGKAYELDAVVPGKAPATARDAAAIVASFGP